MNKKFIKLIALFTTVMIISGIFTVMNLTVSGETAGFPIVDNFDDSQSMTSHGWNSNATTNGVKQDGVFKLVGGKMLYLSGISGSDGWNDYVVEADVSLGGEALSSTGVASIVARQTSANNGYEFGLCDEKGTTYLRIYKRGVSGGKINNEAKKYPLTIEREKKYSLKLVVIGNRLILYCNGLLIDDFTDDSSPYLAGRAGIRSANISSEYDNFIVRDYLDADFPSGGGDGGEESDDVLFSDDFQDVGTMVENGWRNNSGTKQDGVYILNAASSNYANNINGSGGWTDYVVESDVMLNQGEISALYCASIVARSTNFASNGYEFGICETVDGDTYVRLYKRGVSAGVINGETLMSVIEIERGKAYKLKMIVDGSRIVCFFEGTKVFDIIDEAPFANGYIGIRLVGNAATTLPATYDNVIARKINADDRASMDSGEGDGGGEESDDITLFADDFEDSSSMLENGWKSSAGSKGEGVFTLDPGTAAYVNVNGSSKWTDYVVQADVALNSGELKSLTSAAVVARSSGTSDGYEYGICETVEGGTYLRLYKRGSSGGKINGNIYNFNMSVAREEYCNMKMVVIENRIICYFNGMKVFDVTDKDGAFVAGSVGIRSAGTPANVVGSKYDNFLVRKIVAGDITEDKGIDKNSGAVWFSDNFNAESALSDRGWGTDTPEIADGKVVINGSMYTSGINGASSWSDYEVSAKVIVDRAGGLIGEATLGWAAICTRSGGASSGYEYGIITPSSGAAYLRLYDRKNKENIDINKNSAISEGEHILKMSCEDSVLRCYLDGELVFLTTNTVNSFGYAGIRASGYRTSFDDFTVGEVTAETILDHESEMDEPIKSPVTGIIESPVKLITAVVFLVSFVGFAVTVVLGVRDIKNKVYKG